MRKPRDYDAELKALEDKARQLKARKVTQLGELVIATGADALSPEELAGALVALAETRDAGKRAKWKERGEAFFAGRGRNSGISNAATRSASPSEPPDSAARDPEGTLPLGGAAQPAPRSTREG